MFKLFRKKHKEVAHNGGEWTSQEQPNGDLLCTQYGAVRSMCLLRPCELTTELYYIVNATELPTQRYLAVTAALQEADRNYTNDDLTTALAEITKACHGEKSIIQARIKVQSMCEAVSARVNSDVNKAFLEKIALPFAVLKGENPFTYSQSYNDRKTGILNAEPYTKDFFLDIARKALMSY